MVKIILLVFSCYKYVNRIKKLESIEYFLELDKYPQIDYYIVYGNPNLETKYKMEDRNLIVQSPDSYIGFPKKVITTIDSIQQIYSNQDYILLKTDDDFLINVNFIVNNMNLLTSEHYLGSICHENRDSYKGHWNSITNKTPYLYGYMSGENSYLLSKYSCETISNYIKTDNHNLIENSLFEDKLVGDIMYLSNIIAKNTKNWWRNIIPTKCQKYQFLFKKSAKTNKWLNTILLPNQQLGMMNLFGNNGNELFEYWDLDYRNNDVFYFYIRGHIRDSFKTYKLKNFLQLLKLYFPNIKFILQTWNKQECKTSESWKNIVENNTIITKLTIENYFKDTNITDNCLIIDEETIKLVGSTQGTLGSGISPKKGWKNMWYGIYQGIIQQLNIKAGSIIVLFRFDYFDVKQSKDISEKEIIHFIKDNLNTKNIPFIFYNKPGTDNLYMGEYKKIKSLIEYFHFKLDDILNTNKDFENQEILVNIIANNYN